MFNFLKVSCPSLKLSFALLLRIQLVIKLLLEFLFGELHFTNGSVVFDPPFPSWWETRVEKMSVCDIWMSAAFSASKNSEKEPGKAQK